MTEKHDTRNAPARHTPGPWFAQPMGQDDPRWVILLKPDSLQAVAITAQANDAANARLIAAAPDLLEALRRLEGIAENVAQNENFGIMDSALEQARDAIAKAEGRP